MIRSRGKLLEMLLNVRRWFVESQSSYFFRVPVALSTAVVVAGGTNILKEAKKKDFFFIIPCFIDDVSVLLIYDHIVVIEEFSQFKKSFLWHFQYFDRPFFIFTVSRWKKKFFRSTLWNNHIFVKEKLITKNVYRYYYPPANLKSLL